MSATLEEGQHTPGPWSVRETTPGSQYVDEKSKHDYEPAQNVLVVAEGDCETHPIADCGCNHTCRTQWEAEANARLIAAAPDLLALCRSVLPLLDGAHDGSQQYEDMRGHQADEIREVLKRLR